MTVGAIAHLVFEAAVIMSLFTIGLRTRPADALHLLRDWKSGARAFAALYLIVPATVMLLSLALGMPPAVEAALIAVAVAPMLPTLPNDIATVRADHRYMVSLEVLSSLVSLVAAPVAFWIVSAVIRVPLDIQPGDLLASLALGLLLPIALGALLRALFPRWVARVEFPLTIAVGITLLVCLVTILWLTRGLVMAVLDWRALLAVVVLVLVGLVAGHALGGPGRAERAALALTAPSRHIGFALAVGLAVAPNAAPAVTGTILFYFIVRTLMILPYQLQMSRPAAGSAPHPLDRS